MRFSITKKNLEYVAAKIISVIPSKAIKPVLTGALIELTGGRAFISATDMESAIRLEMNIISCEGEGRFIINAKLLTDLAKNMAATEAVFIFNANHLQFQTESANCDIPFMLEDFPPIYFLSDGKTFSFPRETLISMIDSVLYSCAADELMRSLNCILWEFDGAVLRVVSADGFRLSVREETISDVAQNSVTGLKFLVSLKGMREIVMYLRSSREDIIQILFDDKRICMGDDTSKLAIRLIDLEFPDYRRVVPVEFHTKVTINREDMLKQLRFASVVTHTSGESIRISVKQDQLFLFARAVDRGESTIQMRVQKEGNDIQVAFNPKFLIDSLQHFAAPLIEINFVNDSTPLRINEPGSLNYISIIMPVRMS